VKKQSLYLITTVLAVILIQVIVEGGPGEFYSNHFGPDPEPEIESTFIPREKTESEKKAEAFEKILDNIKAGEGYIYKWKDKDGNLQYSNSTFPKNNPTLEIIEELNPHNRETKFYYQGGTIVVQTIIENNGYRQEIKLTLDTGCGITQIHPDVISSLRPRKISEGKSNIADGRTIKTVQYKVDYFHVGPFVEENFVISTNDIKEKHGTDGLLGMNFLLNHPFDIDKKNRVIRWR